jgi:hypothetical protein
MAACLYWWFAVALPKLLAYQQASVFNLFTLANEGEIRPDTFDSFVRFCGT